MRSTRTIRIERELFPLIKAELQPDALAELATALDHG